MALYDSLVLGVEKHPIVLDIGHLYSKVGYGSEMVPRAIIPTAVDQNNPGSLILPEKESLLNKTELIDKLSKFIDHVFFKVLEISPKDKWVVVCESPMTTSLFREALADVLLCVYDCSSVLFAPLHLLVCFTCGVENALVVDASVYETTVMPIICGTPMLWAWNSSNTGSNVINQNVKDALLEDGIVTNKNNSKIDFEIAPEILEDIKIRACFVAPIERSNEIQDFRLNGVKRHGSPEDFEYILNKNILKIPGYIREESAEVLFEKDNDKMSLPYLILDSILACPMDVRKLLSENIVLSGGSCFLPGFSHRVLSEIQEIVKSEDKYGVLSKCIFSVIKPPVHPNIAPWLGGSILASLGSYYKKSVTKEYFVKHNKRLADWCVLDIKSPELIIDRPMSLLSGKKFVPYASKLGTGRRTIAGLHSLKTSTTTKK